MNKISTASMVVFAVLATPSYSFVLLGRQKATLPATPESPSVEFVYDPNGDVPSLSSKGDILEGAYANASDREIMPVILQTAMDQWNNVRGSYLTLTLVAGEGSIERSRSDKINVILAEKNTNASTAAFATPEANPENPDEIYDCDISISLNGVSAQSFLETVTHELGHCVGLGHPHNNYGAIMSYSRGGHSHQLGADDKAGAIYLYPDPAYVDSEPKELIGCGNIGAKAKPSRIALILTFAFPLIAAATSRRKSRLI